MGKRMRRTRQGAFALAAGCVLALAAGETAQGQSASSSMSAFNKGADSYEGPVNVSTRDSSGNLTIVNGVMQNAQGSIFSNLSTLGASSTTSGAGSTSSSGSSGAGSATAIGNNLSVVVNGDYNTVIVNSSQTNTGAVSASTVLNGKVNLDDAQ